MLFDLEPAVWWTRFEFVNSPLVLREESCEKVQFVFLDRLQIWSVSSAGSEHYLDKVGVIGSNPIHFTK